MKTCEKCGGALEHGTIRCTCDNPLALVGPTGYNSFGIIWRNAPALEARGGYSGPFNTQAEAESRAVDLALFYEGAVPSVERVENVNELGS